MYVQDEALPEAALRLPARITEAAQPDFTTPWQVYQKAPSFAVMCEAGAAFVTAMNKAPAFLFYAGDFLSSPDVQSMDTREVGAYVLLLLNAWQGDLPGHLPNNEDRLRRITRMTVAEWETSRELLLSKFPPADMGLTRYNPRLVSEAEKQAENRRKQAENGKRGGRPKKPNESQKNPPLSVGNPTLSKPKANANPNESFSISISSTTDVVEAAAPSPGAPRQVLHPAALKAETDGADTFSFAESFFTKPEVYAAVLRDIGFSEVDALHYFREIAADAKDKDSRLTMPAWRKRLTTWLKNDKSKGCLLLATGNGARPASPDPEADRIRAFAHTQQQQPVSQWKGYQSGPNKPASTSPAGQHTSTIR